MQITDVLAKLQQAGCNVTEQHLTEYLTTAGIEITDITDRAIPSLAEELSRSASLATAQSNKPSKRGNSRKDRTAKPTGILAKTTEELAAFEGALLGGRGQFVEATSDRWVGIIQETPNLAIDAFAEKLGGAGTDPEHFRSRGGEFAQTIFGTTPTSAA